MSILFFPDNAIGGFLQRIIPVPVALIDGSPVSLARLNADRESVRHFYESQSKELADAGFRIDFATEEGRNRLLIRERGILNSLIQDRIIRSLAEERGITVSDEDVQDGIQAAIKEGDGNQETLEMRLRTLYGWSLEDFGQRVVRPSMYRERLTAILAQEQDLSAAKDRIGQAAKALDSGRDFSSVVSEFSEGDSEGNDGDIGWVSQDDLVSGLREAVARLPVGTTGPIVESLLGFHIPLVMERREDDERVSVHLKQIFVRKPSLADQITEEIRRHRIRILLRRYRWNPETGEAEFRKASMRSFEQSAADHADGDPSLLLR